MRNPEELDVFRKADALVVDVYEVTAKYPSEERFGLSNQLRRAAVSIASNITEGCSRESQTEFRRFIEMALGSAMEVRYQLNLAERLGYSPEHTHLVWDEAVSVCRGLINLGKALRAQTPNPKPQTS